MKRNKNHMIISIDVDGVTADLLEVWLEKYNSDYDDKLQLVDIRNWGIHMFVKPECGLSIYEYLKDKTLYKKVKPIKNALESIKKLRSVGRVIFVTTTPIEASGVKYEWLNDNGFDVDLKDYVECSDKSLIRADFLLDDNLTNVSSFHGRGVLFSQFWNAASTYPYRVGSEWHPETGWITFTRMVEHYALLL